jgi:hypothetical protein
MQKENQAHQDQSLPELCNEYQEDSKRRRTERRVHESVGYCYISMVGWMDRRTKSRRQDDGDFV